MVYTAIVGRHIVVVEEQTLLHCQTLSAIPIIFYGFMEARTSLEAVDRRRNLDTSCHQLRQAGEDEEQSEPQRSGGQEQALGPLQARKVGVHI